MTIESIMRTPRKRRTGEMAVVNSLRFERTVYSGLLFRDGCSQYINVPSLNIYVKMSRS